MGLFTTSYMYRTGENSFYTNLEAWIDENKLLGLLDWGLAYYFWYCGRCQRGFSNEHRHSLVANHCDHTGRVDSEPRLQEILGNN